jgi:hypothetical protein
MIKIFRLSTVISPFVVNILGQYPSLQPVVPTARIRVQSISCSPATTYCSLLWNDTILFHACFRMGHSRALFLSARQSSPASRGNAVGKVLSSFVLVQLSSADIFLPMTIVGKRDEILWNAKTAQDTVEGRHN